MAYQPSRYKKTDFKISRLIVYFGGSGDRDILS